MELKDKFISYRKQNEMQITSYELSRCTAEPCRNLMPPGWQDSHHIVIRGQINGKDRARSNTIIGTADKQKLFVVGGPIFLDVNSAFSVT